MLTGLQPSTATTLDSVVVVVNQPHYRLAEWTSAFVRQSKIEFECWNDASADGEAQSFSL